MWMVHVYSCSAAVNVCVQHGASQEDFLRGEVSQAVRDVTYDLASLANTHLLKVDVHVHMNQGCMVPVYLLMVNPLY